MNCGSDLLFGFITMVQQPCAEVFGIVSTRALYQQPNQGLYKGIQMTQSRLGIRMLGSKTMVRFAMNGVRSAGQSSYMGIDGESLLWQIQLAEMNYILQHDEHQLRFSSGINEDFWVKRNNETWQLREIAWGIAEQQKSQSRSDTGLSLLYSHTWIQAGIRISSGEGMRRYERNTGLNTEGLFSVVTSAIQFDIYAREGSMGPSFSKNHRLGSRLLYTFKDMKVGMEVIKNYGIDGDGTRSPLYGSFFSSYQPSHKTIWAYGRWDMLRENVDATGQNIYLGIGIPLDSDMSSISSRLWLGWEGNRRTEQLSLYAGQGILQSNNTFFFQFTGNISTKLQELQ